MSELLVLYDSSCAFCERCRAWLESQRQRVRLRFLCGRSALARERFGALPLGEELVVVGPDGEYWLGPSAFVMSLWALSDWTDVALALGERPGLARAFFGAVSSHRGVLGNLVGAPCHGACEARPASASPYR